MTGHGSTGIDVLCALKFKYPALASMLRDASSTCHPGWVESLILGPNFGTEVVDWSVYELSSCGAWSVIIKKRSLGLFKKHHFLLAGKIDVKVVHTAMLQHLPFGPILVP